MAKGSSIKSKDISLQLQQGFQKVRKKLIEKEKKNNGYLVIAGKDGLVKKIPAKDL